MSKFFIPQFIFPGFYAAYANDIILKSKEEQKGFSVDLSGVVGFEKEYIRQVKVDLVEQLSRKKAIEGKAKFVCLVSVLFVLGFVFLLPYFRSFYFNVCQVFALCFSGLSFLYFVSSVVRAIQAVNIRMFYIVQSEVEVSSKSYKLIAKKSNSAFLKELIIKKQLNDLTNICISNFCYASFDLFRNGIILFVLAFIFTVLGFY